MKSRNLKEKRNRKRLRKRCLLKYRIRGILCPKIRANRKNKNIPWKIMCRKALDSTGYFYSLVKGLKIGISRQPPHHNCRIEIGYQTTKFGSNWSSLLLTHSKHKSHHIPPIPLPTTLSSACPTYPQLSSAHLDINGRMYLV